MFKTDSPRGSLGIMVCRRNNAEPNCLKQRYMALCREGRNLGMRVFVFCPDQIDWSANRICGYGYTGERAEWKESAYEFPNLVYDRCFCSDKTQVFQYRNAIRRFKRNSFTSLLGNSMGNKWKIYRLLRRQHTLSPHLPPTAPLRNIPAFIGLMAGNRPLFLKPVRGSQGKGALHCFQETDGSYAVRGRDRNNLPIRCRFSDADSFGRWLAGYTSGQHYLVQPYLKLHDSNGSAFDIRSLVQKNARGQWQLTGTVIRLGQKGSVTSNLHGGGSALHPMPFLTEQYGKQRAEDIMATICTLSSEIPPVLEASFGRLVELGLDFGADRDGRVWILEANSKPGRTAFLSLQDPRQCYEALYNPVLYARFLLHSRGLTHGSSADRRGFLGG